MDSSGRKAIGWDGPKSFGSVNQAWDAFGERVFDISRRTFYNWVGESFAEDGVGPRAGGQFHVDDIVTFSGIRGWRLTTFGRRVIQEGGGGNAEGGEWSLKREQAEARLAIAKAEKAEDELRKSRGELLDRSEMEKQMAAFAGVVGSELEGAAYRLPPEIVHRVGGSAEKVFLVQEILLEAFRELMNLLARGDEYEVAFPDVPEDAPPLLSGASGVPANEGEGEPWKCVGSEFAGGSAPDAMPQDDAEGAV